MNTFHNAEFIFDNDFEFGDRTGKERYYSGEGDLITVRPGNHMWETNFVTDLAAIELKSWGDRGAGGTNIMFVLADGSMHAHISEMPVGTYKKGHRHGPGFHVMCVTGHGYSLLLVRRPAGLRAHRLEARHGVPAGRPAVPPALQRRPATGPLSRHRLRRPALSAVTNAQRRSLLGLKPGEKGAVSTNIKEGGDQIEYEDQDKHPRDLARGNEEERRRAEDGQDLPRTRLTGLPQKRERRPSGRRFSFQLLDRALLDFDVEPDVEDRR